MKQIKNWLFKLNGLFKFVFKRRFYNIWMRVNKVHKARNLGAQLRCEGM